MLRKLFTGVCVLCLGFTQSAFANNMLIILDGSNSMWGQIEGTAKIESAREALDTILTDLPPELNVGLMAYGHTSKDSCTDVAMLSPIEKVDADKIKGSVTDLKPTGKTPIGYALEQGGKALVEKSADSNTVVLVSDGIETCEGDPCAVAEKLAKEGVDTRVHVVGFDVNAEAKEQLECIAEKGNGKYFAASNAQGLKDALGEVKEEVKKTAFEKPAAPVAKEYFRDDFDGTDLGEHWEIMNPDPDSFIVEDDKLLIVTDDFKGLANADFPNLFKLTKEMPEGDWEAEIAFTLEAPTALETVYLGSYSEPEKWVASRLSFKDDKYYGHKIYVEGLKHTGADTNSLHKILDNITCNVCRPDWQWNGFYDKKIKDRKFVLKLRKIGRNYMAAGEINEPGMEDYKKVAVEGLKSLRPMDNLVLGFSHLNKSNGESSIFVDYLKVSTLTKEEAEALEAEASESAQ